MQVLCASTPRPAPLIPQAESHSNSNWFDSSSKSTATIGSCCCPQTSLYCYMLFLPLFFASVSKSSTGTYISLCTGHTRHRWGGTPVHLGFCSWILIPYLEVAGAAGERNIRYLLFFELRLTFCTIFFSSPGPQQSRASCP
ncbi:hypothetical protein I7I53_11207 [Histoplasma capsulatum var. duboisii H88]|uniref:Uncharacterized protein n=1 Tax=Ajellomyces capsulatus (strain H88) TaxID=544711 RepID=A0A8A1L961_AJEC8|nr:hypothetical protein I7I53_11207 [Histoplasma capsulatum var. duboisii H88]